MAICIHTGLELPDNVANDPRKRPGYYRYRLSSGKWQTIKGTYEDVCERAHKANKKRGIAGYSAKSVRFWVDRYTEWMEGQNPALATPPGCWFVRPFFLYIPRSDWLSANYPSLKNCAVSSCLPMFRGLA